MSIYRESLKQVNLDLIRYESEIEGAVKLGEALTIVSHPFAEPIDNQALLQMATLNGLPKESTEEAARAISATGFTNRFLSNGPNERLSLEKTTDRASSVGGILLKKILKANDWDNVDVFIDTSAFLPANVNELTLEKAGLNPNKIIKRSYRYACAGAVSAFIDCLSDPSLKDARVVIAALEPLSQVLSPDHFTSPERLVIPSIFGDANTLMAFSPKNFHLENKNILIQPDGGVIKVKTLYDFKNTDSAPETIPTHYSFAGGGENIFHHSSSGAFLDIPYPTNGSLLSMDGKKTGFFFGDQTAMVITELLKEYGNLNLLRELGNKNVILHPASKPVVDRIAKLLWRNPQKYLESPHLQFLMDKARESNSSSATTLNRWRYMIQNDLIDPRLPLFWIAPGIGSAIAGAIGWIKP